MALAPVVLVAAAIANSQSTFSPIGYETFKWGPNRYHVVTADLRSGALQPATVHSPRLTSVWNLVKQKQPVAAITGTFFAPSSHRPVADVLVDGNLVARGHRGSVVAVDWFGGVKIFDPKFQQKVDWSSYQFALRGAVRVIQKGKVQPNPKAQKFKDKRIWGRAARTGVGITKQGKLVLVATKNQVTLSELGKAMKQKGVQEAVSLDGGGSTCLYYNGSLVVPPQRKLSTMFVIGKR
ncbi:MAG TPA: phosphodiester glycosidase family protein [Fimbriimonadaceae bacterium]|nr:phosphodiester glycosidase family protein [Fimbriimonadaceae bacterium]